MDAYNWSRFTLRLNVDCSINDIYNLWCTPQGLESWFLRKAEFKRDGYAIKKDMAIKPGDTYNWLWHGYSDKTFETGKIINVNQKDLIHFTFGKAGEVSVQIKPENGVQIVELLQQNIPVDEASKVNFHLGCITGWTFYLTNLKSILEGGIDLRNKDARLTKMINA